MIRKREKIAYIYEEGDESLPVLIFLPGFRSDMQGAKAQYLAERCKARSQPCLRLDYSGHGQSGGKFTDGTIGAWVKDALSVIDHIAAKDVLLVGSSMGGWIALQIALQRKQIIKGLVGIAAAPDFTRQVKSRLTAKQKQDLKSQGFFAVPSEYDDDLVFTEKLLEEGETQCLLDAPIDLDIPVRLIQGKLDEDVPWQTAELIESKLIHRGAEIIYIEDGGHRLSRPEDLQRIDDVVVKLSEKIRNEIPTGD